MQQVDSHLLSRLIPWLLAVIVLYTVFRPAVGAEERPPRMKAGVFFAIFGLLLGFYDGFFGPGAGAFWAISLIVLLGQNFARATAHTKVMNAASNVMSVALFARAGLVDFTLGLAMGAGQLVGTWLGSRLVVRRGSQFIRPIFLIVVTLTLLRLLWVNYR